MVLYTGATVEEAIQKGLNDLDIPRMKAHITVVAREKKGFLGLFGKKPAQVEIEPIAETTVVKANQKAVLVERWVSIKFIFNVSSVKLADKAYIHWDKLPLQSNRYPKRNDR